MAVTKAIRAQGSKGIKVIKGTKGIKVTKDKGSKGIKAIKDSKDVKVTKAIKDKGSKGIKAIKGIKDVKAIKVTKDKGSKGIKAIKGIKVTKGTKGITGTKGIRVIKGRVLSVGCATKRGTISIISTSSKVVMQKLLFTDMTQQTEQLKKEFSMLILVQYLTVRPRIFRGPTVSGIL